MNTVPDKLLANATPKENQITVVRLLTTKNELVAQRKFKFGGEDPTPWLNINWYDGLKWSVSVQMFTPHPTVYADKRGVK